MSKCQLNYETIEKYRYVNVEDNDWYEYIFANFEEDMCKHGVKVDNIYFSGFWSQGDGACFDGSVQDWGLYLLHLGYDDQILTSLAHQTWWCNWKRRGHHSHENSALIDSDLHMGENPYCSTSDGLRHDAWQHKIYTYDFLAIQEEIEKNLRGHMKALYEQLREEYDYLTSDECVIEWIEANTLTELEI